MNEAELDGSKFFKSKYSISRIIFPIADWISWCQETAKNFRFLFFNFY